MKFSELEQLEGVGESISKDFKSLGINSIKDLKDKNPETLYEELMKKQNKHIDRCMLYVFRCAIYQAKTKNPKEELCKWWNWKDK